MTLATTIWFMALAPAFFEAAFYCVALLPDLFWILCFEDWLPSMPWTALNRPRLLPLLPIFFASLVVLLVFGRVGICKSLLAFANCCYWMSSCWLGCIAMWVGPEPVTDPAKLAGFRSSCLVMLRVALICWIWSIGKRFFTLEYWGC